MLIESSDPLPHGYTSVSCACTSYGDIYLSVGLPFSLRLDAKSNWQLCSFYYYLSTFLTSVACFGPLQRCGLVHRNTTKTYLLFPVHTNVDGLVSILLSCKLVTWPWTSQQDNPTLSFGWANLSIRFGSVILYVWVVFEMSAEIELFFEEKLCLMR